MIRSNYFFLLLLGPLRLSVSLCQEIENTPPNSGAGYRKAVLMQFGTPEKPFDTSPLSEAYFNRKLDKAQKLNTDLLIVEVDSPAGFGLVGFEVCLLGDGSLISLLAQGPQCSCS